MITKQEEKRLTWQRHIESWKNSGKTQRSYCDEHNIRVHQLWYWNRRLKLETTADTPQTPPPKKTDSAFVPVKLDPCEVNGQGLHIALPNGLVIHGMTPHTLPFLKQLIRAIA